MHHLQYSKISFILTNESRMQKIESVLIRMIWVKFTVILRQLRLLVNVVSNNFLQRRLEAMYTGGYTEVKNLKNHGAERLP